MHEINDPGKISRAKELNALIQSITLSQFASLIDATYLKADSTFEKINEIAEIAKQFHCASVCVNPSEVEILPLLLKGSDIKDCYVIDFPLGKSGIKIKTFQTEYIVAQSRKLRGEGKGKTELDMVIDLGRFKTDPTYTLEEINSVCQAADGELVKVIIKSPELTEQEIISVSEVVARSDAGFIKNSTGMDSFGATPEHIKLMREVVGEDIGVKAAGGIRDAMFAIELIKAGAERSFLQEPRFFRLGSSSPVQLITEFNKLKTRQADGN